MNLQHLMKAISIHVADAALEGSGGNHTVAAIAAQAAAHALTCSALAGMADPAKRAEFEAAMAQEREDLQALIGSMLAESGITYPTPSA